MMQKNERRQDARFADALTSEEQAEVDKLSGGVWDKVFIAGVGIVLGIGVLAAPLLSGLSRLWPPLGIFSVSLAVLAFAAACASIPLGAAVRRRSYLSGERAQEETP